MSQDEHDATLGEITRTIFGTLQGMLVDNGGPFKAVVRIASDKAEKDTGPHIAGLPALMLPPATEKYETEAGDNAGLGLGNTLVEKHRYFLGTSTWRIYVVARKMAAIEPDGVDTVALEDLIDLVVKKVSGLFIPGLYLNERVVPLDSEIVSLSPGQYVQRLRFTARRVISAFDVPDGSVPFSGMTGEVHLDGQNFLVDPFSTAT